jgi:signal transduction histidine kinase
MSTEHTTDNERQNTDPAPLSRDHLLREIKLKDRFLAANLLELERTKGKLRQVLASMSGAVLMIELDGYLSVANARARTLLGIDQDFPILANRVLPEALQDILDEVIGDGSHVHRDELEITSSSGSVGTYRLECRLVRDDTDRPIGVLQVLEDRTELILMEQRLEQSHTLAALGEMAASVAHELRNPLGGIGGFAALLSERLADDSDEKRYVHRIIEGVNGLNKVATNLLAYTRPVDPRYQQVDLRMHLREVLAFVHIEIEQDDLPVTLTVELGDEPYIVFQDPELLRQSFLNLFKNAVQAFEGETGHVSCVLRGLEEEHMVEVEIRDDGPGITIELQQKVFNPFFTTRAKGTGLGLAIVRKNVELQGGSISLDSEPGEGAIFSVRLPLRQEDA